MRMDRATWIPLLLLVLLIWGLSFAVASPLDLPLGYRVTGFLVAGLIGSGLLVVVVRHQRVDADGQHPGELARFLSELVDMVIIVDAHDSIVNIVGPVAAWGWSLPASLGRPWSTLFGDDQATHLAPLMAALRTPEAVAGVGPVTCTITLPSGRPLLLQVRGVALPFSPGSWRYVVLRDVTQQEQLNLRLGRMDHLSSIAHLTAGITHNFNNLFASIILHADLLRTARGAEKERMAARVAEAAQRGGELCRKLMTFARGEHPSISALPLAALVHDSVTLVEPQAMRRGIEVAVHCPEQLVVRADPGHVQQILVNLLLNAIEAIGGDALHGEIRVTARIQDDRALLAVTNNGPPIPPERVPVIFLPFFSTKESTMQGVGMGLAVSRSLALGMGGQLDVESEPEGWTTFTLTLPVADHETSFASGGL